MEHVLRCLLAELDLTPALSGQAGPATVGPATVGPADLEENAG